MEKLRVIAALIGTPLRRQFIRELLAFRVLSSPSRLKELIRTTYELGLFSRNSTLKSVFDDICNTDSVAYFYWGIGQVNALLLKRPWELPFTACRFHGWDLYEERHESGYIPYRTKLLQVLDLLLPISEHGRKYLNERYNTGWSRAVVSRLGTTSAGRSATKADGVLKIVSCSNMVEVKRLDLLCEALANTAIPVRWTHIGGGELMPKIRDYVGRFPANVKADLLGAIPASTVANTLAQGSFDLFVNTSRSEGVPVSIMEALAAGIPVFATDVGGTREIVDDQVGKLIPADSNAAEIAAMFHGFFTLDEAVRTELRDNAFRRFQERCDSEANAEALAHLLLERFDARATDRPNI